MTIIATGKGKPRYVDPKTSIETSAPSKDKKTQKDSKKASTKDRKEQLIAQETTVHAQNFTEKQSVVNDSLKKEDLSLDAVKEIEITKLFKENNVGILPSHAIKIQKVAKEKKLIIGSRPVESVVAGLIAGGAPTKDFHTKGKSATGGPQAGYIPRNQHYSKKNGLKKDIIKYNAEVEKGFAQGHYKFTNLKLSKARIEELRDELNVIETSKTSNNNENITIYWKSPSGIDEKFTAKYNLEDNMYEIFDTKDNSPVEVIADLQLGKPLTADCDLLLVATEFSEFKSEGKDTRAGKIAIMKNPYIDHKDKLKHITENENSELGNITERISDLIGDLNTAIGRGPGLNLFHHSDDSGNPFSNIEDNFPATFYLPEAIDKFADITVIKDKQMFDEFIIAIKDAGYHFEDQPSWNIPKRPSFKQARKIFNN